MLLGAFRVATVGGGEVDGSHAAKETLLFWVGFVPQRQFGSVAVLPTRHSHS